MGEILAPVERRAERLQLLPAQFVIQLGWIAALYASERSFRKCSLDLHDSLCFGRSGIRLIAQQLEHLLDVDQVFLPPAPAIYRHLSGSSRDPAVLTLPG